MRKHRFCENDISNFESQMTTGGVRGDSMILGCRQHHGYSGRSRDHFWEGLKFRISEESHFVGNFTEIFPYF